VSDKERIEELENDNECLRWMLQCAKTASVVDRDKLNRAIDQITPDEVNERHNKNLRTLDDMSTWIGEFSDRAIGDLHIAYESVKKTDKKAAQRIADVIEELQEAWDGYHTVEGKSPWS
jgi:hypothetical protein